MWTISKSEVADLLRLDLSTRLQEAREKVRLFERVHQQSFETFEQAALQEEEDYERWDDYVEWKAYRQLQQDLSAKLNALQHGDFEVA